MSNFWPVVIWFSGEHALGDGLVYVPSWAHHGGNYDTLPPYTCYKDALTVAIKLAGESNASSVTGMPVFIPYVVEQESRPVIKRHETRIRVVVKRIPLETEDHEG